MTKRVIALLLAVILCLGAFSGCRQEKKTPGTDPASTAGGSPSGTNPSATTEPAPTVPPQTDPPVEGDVPRRLVNGGERDYAEDGYVEMVKFSEMEYVRPDTESICDHVAALTEMVKRGEDPDKILAAYYDVSDEILNFRTMNNLAYIHYTLDTNDNYYKDEYDALELASSDIAEKAEAFYKACAYSSVREALERDYFGYGFFDKYEDYEVFTNPEYLALKKQEDALLADYREALQDPQIEYRGETQSFNELMAKYENIQTYSDYLEYLNILELYYTQYNQTVGKIYLELVKVRKQEAEVLGYDSYADYCYEIVYERDYTHEQGVDFLAQIRTELVPLAAEIDSKVSVPNHFSISQPDMKQSLLTAVENMGGRINEAYRFMIAYDLCDLSTAPEKFDSSFTVYLSNYEAPYLTVNSQGTTSDYITFSHEFGHFVDKYVTYDADEDLETAETFSQAMEFLSLCYTEGVFTDQQAQQLLKLNLTDTLDTFIFQGALAEFEDRVYALELDELTLDRVNGIYRQCCKDYGIYEAEFDFFYTYRWFEVTHFFEVPYYVISYTVSADTALQVYQLEKEEKGAGLAAFERLLDREPDDGVQAVMTASGLDNPFREGAIAELAEFYRQELGLR